MTVTTEPNRKRDKPTVLEVFEGVIKSVLAEDLDAAEKLKTAKPKDRAALQRKMINALGIRSVESYRNVLGKSVEHKLPSDPEFRHDVMEKVANLTDTVVSGDEIRLICASVLAWGGMRKNSFQSLFNIERTEKWLELSKRLRIDVELTREQAYLEFLEIRGERVPDTSQGKSKLLGMGPAYFTKLIYFLQPTSASRRGYILDQWAGWSINELFPDVADPIVKMDETYSVSSKKSVSVSMTVSDANDATSYENFCSKIDELISYFETKPEIQDSGYDAATVIDRAFMSGKKDNPDTWRGYLVKQQRKRRGFQ
jgi:hypothetical protein